MIVGILVVTIGTATAVLINDYTSWGGGEFFDDDRPV